MKEIQTEAGKELLRRAISWGEAENYAQALIADMEGENGSNERFLQELLTDEEGEYLKRELNRCRPGDLTDKDLLYLKAYAKQYYSVFKDGKRPETLTPIEAMGLLSVFYEDPDNFAKKSSGKYEKGVLNIEGEEAFYLIDAKQRNYWQTINRKLKNLYDSNLMSLDPIIYRENDNKENGRAIEDYLRTIPNNDGIAWGLEEGGRAIDISDFCGYLNKSKAFNVILWIEDTLRFYSYVSRPAAVSFEEQKEIRPFVFDEKWQSNVAITKEGYEGALDPKRNQHAYIIKTENGLPFFIKIETDKDGKEHGIIIKDKLTDDKIMEYTIKALEETDTVVLRNIFGIVYERYTAGANIDETIEIDVLEFAKTFNIRFEKNEKGEYIGVKDHNRRDLGEIIASIQNVWGIIGEKETLAAFTFEGFNETTIKFRSPYSSALIKLIVKKPLFPEIEHDNGYKQPPLLEFNTLIKSSITSSRAPKVTAEIVKTITNKMLTDGAKGRQTEIKLSLSDLIEKTPLLEYQFNKAETWRRSQVLNRALYGQSYKPGEKPIIEKVLNEYTRIEEKYNDFSIMLPEHLTYKKLDETIKVRFTKK